MNRRLDCSAIALACLCLLLSIAPGRAAAAVAPNMAVTDLDYVDTSGEVRNEASDHSQRLKAFADALRSNLTDSGKFRIVALNCEPAGCATAASDPTALLAAARKAGADYVLIGGVHKMSTLIQWAKIDIVDVNTRRIVFDKLLSFRGDSEAAWDHAEGFLVQEILQQNAFK